MGNSKPYFTMLHHLFPLELRNETVFMCRLLSDRFSNKINFVVALCCIVA
jgi:hypothetical protein